MKKTLAAFRTRIDGDEAIRQRLRAGEDPVAVAHEIGYDVTWEDIQGAIEDSSVELTDFEMELVSGGVNTEGTWGKGVLPGTQTPIDPVLPTDPGLRNPGS
jgi:predicted ribosomally synthesized peptide with nif11-like leader